MARFTHDHPIYGPADLITATTGVVRVTASYADVDEGRSWETYDFQSCQRLRIQSVAISFNPTRVTSGDDRYMDLLFSVVDNCLMRTHND